MKSELLTPVCVKLSPCTHTPMCTSSIEHGSTGTNYQFYGSVGPLECIFIALLALSNEGAPAHFFHLIEASTMRLSNVKILLCWPSRMQIYGFVENHTFLEQFVSRGVPAQFSFLWLCWPS